MTVLFTKSHPREKTPLPPPAPLAGYADPRICLLLVAELGLLAWKVAPAALCVYLAGMLAVCWYGKLMPLFPHGAVKRTMQFALFWPLLKLVLDSVVFWGGSGGIFFPAGTYSGEMNVQNALGVGGNGDALAFWQHAFEGAGIMFLRLLVILIAALLLTALTSPRSLGLALTWVLRPVLGKHAWKPALALALMAQYLPLIHHIIAQTRITAKSRGLPASGFAYWRMAFPHIFRMLAANTWKQAMAVASRQLATPDAWVMHEPLRFPVLLAGGTCALIIALLALL